MIFRDQLTYAFGNLRKTRLRTFLTAAGVATGIGAMSSMVSVGLGTQRTVIQAFNEGNILTSIMVHTGGDRNEDLPIDSLPTLDSTTTESLRSLPGVRDAFPRLTIAGMLRYGEEQFFRSLEGMPARVLMEQLERGSVEMIAGRPYAANDSNVIVLSESAAERLVADSGDIASLLGQELSFLAATAPGALLGSDSAGLQSALPGGFPTEALPRSLMAFPFAGMIRNLETGLFLPTSLELEVVGIAKGGGSLNDFVGMSLWVPVETVEPLHSQTFQDLESILTGDVGDRGYPVVQVLATDVIAVRSVQDTIQAMGFAAESILDEIDQVRRGFMFMNSMLGSIGGVSLFVAAMMIVNTLVMAVLERTREIGLLKSMGATDGDVMRLFLTEAGVIGVLGGVGGLTLGYVVARITNMFANMQFARVGEVAVDLVAFTPLLMTGGMAFALIVSLLAGYYPARRAAKVEPVVALRHF